MRRKMDVAAGVRRVPVAASMRPARYAPENMLLDGLRAAVGRASMRPARYAPENGLNGVSWMTATHRLQ